MNSPRAPWYQFVACVGVCSPVTPSPTVFCLPSIYFPSSTNYPFVFLSSLPLSRVSLSPNPSLILPRPSSFPLSLLPSVLWLSQAYCLLKTRTFFLPSFRLNLCLPFVIFSLFLSLPKEESLEVALPPFIVRAKCGVHIHESPIVTNRDCLAVRTHAQVRLA